MTIHNLPPLPAWPSEVFPDEPANGYFQRLAEQNNQISVFSLATRLGLNPRNIPPEGFLDLALRFPSENKEELIAATPKSSGHLVELRGEKFRFPRDWSTKNPRICPACVFERPYYRNWFALNIFRTCPVHGVELVGGSSGGRLSWWYPKIGIVPTTGENLAAPARQTDPGPTLERYVLGRLGVVDPWHIAMLDELEIFQVVDVAELLGLAKIHGWSRSPPARHRKHTDEWRQAVAAGFYVLAGGPYAIRDALKSYSRGSGVMPIPGRTNYRYDQYWGWLRVAATALEPSNLSLHLMRTLVDVAAEEHVFSRKGGAALRAQAGLYGLQELATKFSIAHSALLKVAVKLGLAENHSKRAQAHCFDKTAVEELADVLADLVQRDKAAALLGMAPDQFERFCLSNRISPFIRLGRTPKSDRFRRSEVDVHRHIEAKRPKEMVPKQQAAGRIEGATVGRYYQAAQT